MEVFPPRDFHSMKFKMEQLFPNSIQRSTTESSQRNVLQQLPATVRILAKALTVEVPAHLVECGGDSVFRSGVKI